MKEKIKYALAGVLAGVANGLFGAGGGMILVPAFCRFVKMDEKKAFATAVAVTLPLSIVSASVYVFKGDFDIKAAIPFVIGGTLGGLVGGRVFKKVSVRALRIIFSLFMMYGGIRLFVR